MPEITFGGTTDNPAGGMLECKCGTRAVLRVAGKLEPGPLELVLTCSCGEKGALIIGGEAAAISHIGMGGGSNNIMVDNRDKAPAPKLIAAPEPHTECKCCHTTQSLGWIFYRDAVICGGCENCGCQPGKPKCIVTCTQEIEGDNDGRRSCDQPVPCKKHPWAEKWKTEKPVPE